MHARADVACVLLSIMRRCIAAGTIMLLGCYKASGIALTPCVSAALLLVVSPPGSYPLSRCRYKRLITCKTYLKRLNITQPMAEHLLPLHDLNPAGRPRTSADGGSDDDARRGGSSYDQLFKEQVVLVDEAGGSFRVQYEGVACNAQKHLRLTCGWRDYIRHHNVEVGEWDGCQGPGYGSGGEAGCAYSFTGRHAPQQYVKDQVCLLSCAVRCACAPVCLAVAHSLSLSAAAAAGWLAAVSSSCRRHHPV